MAKNDVAGDLLSQNYELQKKFNEFFRQINQVDGYPFVFNKLTTHLQEAVEGHFLSPVGHKNHPKFSLKSVYGYEMEIVGEGTNYEIILSVQSSNKKKYALNAKVVINRPVFGLKKGDVGDIITILEPGKNGCSSDIIVVKTNKGIFHFKMKEIDLV